MKKIAFIFISIVALIYVITFFFGSEKIELPEDVEEAYSALPNKLDYNVDVKPILSDKCFACHGPDVARLEAGLRLDVAVSAYAELPENKGKYAVKPGNSGKSELSHRILSDDPMYIMPSANSNLTLSAKEKAILIKWIEEGAEYKPHWAFVKPTKSKVPSVDKDFRVSNEIDNFIVAKIVDKKLTQSKEADKELLLRRLSLDLTGLPPTIQEIDDFLNDNSPHAYEKQVDRLLNSPHYGEKMATDWLDVARFADSHGYTVDRIRDMSPYRDWVIKAFNTNMNYDKFLQWQLAGDLMPNPNKEMRIATAFNRNHQQNMEGGIIEEEFQTEYVVDRTNTFGDAMLGITVSCAKCHDHKYDPISQKNYYELFSFFNNVKEAGQISFDDTMPAPTMLLPSKKQEIIIKTLNQMIQEQDLKINTVEKNKESEFKRWLESSQFASLTQEDFLANGLQASYSFDHHLKDAVDSRNSAELKRDGGPGDAPNYVSAHSGAGLKLNGDGWLDLNPTGIFAKDDPFSISIWVYIPKSLKEGVIFHKSNAERLYNFKGYHLLLKDNKLEINLSHAYPADAITKLSTDVAPRDKWINLTMTYNGSSKASGLRLYVDGIDSKMETVTDRLVKDILFPGWQPALQLGGWARGKGFTDGQIDEVKVYSRNLNPIEIEWIAGIGKSKANLVVNDLSDIERNSLRQFYFETIDRESKIERSILQHYKAELTKNIEPVQELMVMEEMDKPKKAYLLKRGNYDMLGEEVFPNTPESILSFSKDLPKNRFGLAQWLTDPENPLTARVAVNRLWQNFFGVGLVKTSEDFGNQGEMPSHLELLDWLAVKFMESGWDIKAINKKIVMSATYRQDSKMSDQARQIDVENRLLSCGPTNRLTAEMIRDNALFASGLMNNKIGGKSIKPYQPEGLWEINNTTYQQDKGQDIYRRSLYVIVKRSVPNPTLSTFDATSRSYCVVRRQKTDTPLQALVTLNDPTYLEAAKVLGENMAKMKDINQAIQDTFRKLTGRKPSEKELHLLRRLQENEWKKFKHTPQKIKGWIHTGQYLIDPSLDSVVIAANAVVASTIINSDASITKR